ncbi:hypothetical protein TorRG33x02_340200 [Trema orientale]|uniref:Uncharacterized protein n=1 Tax=Trema orientale TaxID=63057 RepID=A0A2P5AVK1_TREOI|nr:hypothetical protein TorRG33x02_340200 [Trema orientale]
MVCWGGGVWEENNLDILLARHSVPADMIEENILSPNIYSVRWLRFAPHSAVISSIFICLGSSTQLAPPCIDETTIVDEVIDIRKGYKRKISSKLKEAASTSSAVASSPYEAHVPDAEL